MEKIVKLFLLAQLLDLLTTLVGIIYFGAVEGNPIISLGLPRLIIFKFISMLIVAILLMTRIKTYGGKTAIPFAVFLTVFSFLPPIWNTFVIVLTIITGNGVI